VINVYSAGARNWKCVALAIRNVEHRDKNISDVIFSSTTFWSFSVTPSKSDLQRLCGF